MCWWTLIGIFIVYKILDWLIRIPHKRKGSDKHILITGCDTGFGNILAKRLSKKGCHVIAACLTEKGEDELKKACPNNLITVSMNLAKTESIKKAYDTVRTSVPVDKGLWAIVNNAGIVGKVGPTEWLTVADFEETFKVNLFGMAEVTRIFLPLLKRSRKGRIVNTASIVGRLATPMSAPYVCSKYGVEAYSDIIRRELKPFGISVHIVEPGFHKTNLTDARRTCDSLTSAWNSITPELQKEYGQQFYDTVTEALSVDVPKVVSASLDDVVDAYENAMFAVFPRGRYQVGWDSRLIFIPLSNMPACIQDFILNLLQRRKVIPDACRK